MFSLITVLVLCTTLIVVSAENGLSITFIPPEVHLNIDEVTLVQIRGGEWTQNTTIKVQNEREFVASVDNQVENFVVFENGSWCGEFNVTGVFLGTTKIWLEWTQHGLNSSNSSDSSNYLSVVTGKEKTVLDIVFAALALVLVVLLCIIIGTAIDLNVVHDIITRPIGPAVGFASQFVCMPLISFGLGYLIFPDIPAFQLGLFFTGISPGGGMSNFFTYLLNGNLNLSVTMTTISVVAAFGTIPFWIYTLGRTLLDQNNISLPYLNMVGTAIGLIILLAVGVLLQKYRPNLMRIMVKILKPILIVLIIALSVIATIVNQYIFKVLTWNIVLAGLALPLSGYIVGWVTAKLVCRPTADATAISVEIGIQNTGIAIFLLASVDQPPLIPIAVSMMTPIPLGVVYLIVKIKQRWFSNSHRIEECIADTETSLITAK